MPSQKKQDIMHFLPRLKSMALCAAFAGLTLCALMMSASAQDATEGLLPSAGTTVEISSGFSTEEETHPPLRLTPDKSEIINLDEEVRRVIIGNDTHVNILTDTATRLIIVPRIPGATYFTLLNREGKVIMQRHVIVANPKEKYVRVRQTCRGNQACMPIRMYYCPGMCHEIAMIGEDGRAFSGSMASEEDDDDEAATNLLQELIGAEGGSGGDGGGGDEGQ